MYYVNRYEGIFPALSSAASKKRELLLFSSSNQGFPTPANPIPTKEYPG
jgi:hypothetical protein